VDLLRPLPNPPWFRAVKTGLGIVLLMLAVVLIVGGFQLEDFFLVGALFILGGVHLGLFGAYLIITSLSRPKPIGEVLPLELQVTSQKTRVYQVGLIAMVVAIVIAPFAYFLRGVFITLLQLAVAGFCVAFMYASRKIRCPSCGGPLPFEIARRAVGTHVPSWRPNCPRCRAAI
jgi:hypothetical protein